MTDADKPHRPWHRKKRWRAAILALLLGPPLTLPVIAGHALYLAGRGDVPATVMQRLTLFRAWAAVGDSPTAKYQRYLHRCWWAGRDERSLSSIIAKLEAAMSDVDDPRLREQAEILIDRHKAEREQSRSIAPYLFR